MTTETIAIVTGTSRGLGEALALQLIAQRTPLIAIARNSNDALNDRAAALSTPLTQIQADLSDPETAQSTCQDIAALIPRNITRCLLINNAGSIHPIANTADLSDAHTLNQAFTLNVTSPMLLCSTVLQTAAQPGVDCRILNISSGAGRSPTPGWGVYCATKAAVDLYTRVLSEEHPEIRAVSLAPGVIDTDMQQTIRSSDEGDFPDIERFRNLHKQGQLASSADTARHIIQYIERDDFGTTVLDDIRNYF